VGKYSPIKCVFESPSVEYRGEDEISHASFRARFVEVADLGEAIDAAADSGR
jgi:hypothetical protein